VEFAPKTLESIRFESSRAMNGAGRTGIGGVLLGTQAGCAYRVFDWRPIACDHSRGPGFLLSQRDAAGMAAFLDGVRLEAARRQWKILGWFVSHPHEALMLSGEERAVQKRFFPADGIAVVIQPDRMGDAACAVFLASEPEPSVLFHVEPLPIERKDLGARRARTHGTRRAAPREEPAELADAGGAMNPRRSLVFAGAVVALCAVAGGAMWWAMRPGQPAMESLPPPTPIEILSLHAGPRGGRFAIDWNGQAQALRFASRARLIIRDGEKEFDVPLTREEAMSGLRFFEPRTGHVRVKFRLESADGSRFEEETAYKAGAAEERPAVPMRGEVISPAAPAPEKHNAAAGAVGGQTRGRRGAAAGGGPGAAAPHRGNKRPAGRKVKIKYS
jgi:proteasome lid subunit RPN8/RPN11